MELEQQWRNMGTAEDTHSVIDFYVPAHTELKKTASPLFKIKKGLETGMCWAIIIFLMYVAGAFLFKPLFTKLSLLLLAGSSIYCFIKSLQLHQQIGPMIVAGNSLKAELERHYRDIMHWCKTQERNAVFLYPVSILGGAMLGLSTTGEEKMDRILHKPVLWIALALMTVLLVPLLYLMSRQIMKVAYYKHLEHLKRLIELLEQP